MIHKMTRTSRESECCRCFSAIVYVEYVVQKLTLASIDSMPVLWFQHLHLRIIAKYAIH